MTPTYDEAGLRIGEALRRTRTRRRIDIATVEAATKVRAKYLRALENEEWDVLPGAAYAKGFLRTYADYLGLDGDALVDEYRRTVDSSLGANQGYSLSEPVLEHHARPGEPRRWWGRRTGILIAVAAAILIVLLVVGLVGGGSKHRARHGHHQKGKQGHHASAGAGPGGG